MGELTRIYRIIQSDIIKDNVKEAFDTFNIHYNNVKDIKGFQNFTVGVISTLAQKLQSQLTNQKIQSENSANYIIQFAEHCLKLLALSELQPLENSLYVFIRYLLLNNHVSRAVNFSTYLLNKSSPTCVILKDLVPLFAHYIHKTCPIDDNLKKLNVILVWDTVLNLVKCYTEKEIEYALCSLKMLTKNINGSILHEDRSMDLVILDMTLESVLSSSVFRKKSDTANITNLFSMLIENIAAVMQNMMQRKQMHVHFLIKHLELIMDICFLNPIDKEALSFFIPLFKFIDNSVKNGLNSNLELKKMIDFVQKYECVTVLPNTILYYVFKIAIVTIIKLKNVWFEKLIIHSSNAVSLVFKLLQHLVCLSKHNQIDKLCCKNSNCNLNEDSISEMNLINVAFIMARHIITTNDTFLNTEDLLKWMELFTSLFERISKSNCSNRIPFFEFSLTSIYNLCTSKTSDKLTYINLNFLENVLLILDPNGLDPDLVARVAVLLSQYLYKTNKTDEALSCIAYWCVRTRSELTAKQWVYLKCKEEINSRPIKHTILNMIKINNESKQKWPEYSLKKSDHIEIMWLELKAHNNQNKIKKDITAVLELFNELIGSKLSRELKCQVIITTAFIILHSNSIDSLKTIIDVLEDYIRKLEVEILLEKKNMPLMLGNLYYAHFICLFKHLQNLVCKELDSYSEERLESGMEQHNGIQYQPMSWILPLKIKPKLFNCLNLAVQNWSTLTNDSIKDEYDIKILYKSLQEVAFIFKLHCDPKEVEVWKLLFKLASTKKCHKHIFIALSELVKIGEVDILELDNLTTYLPKMLIDYKLILATSLLNQLKFNDAKILLENIDDGEVNKNVLLMAEYLYLKSRLCFESGKFDNIGCLCIFIEAYNLAHSLIKRLDSFYEYLAMHFVILNICSYLNLIYINSFKPVEARCFLKVQMNIVLKSVLSKRALNVFLMNCWNELMCCNFESANQQFEHVMTLLDFKEDEFDSKLQKLTMSRSPNISASPLSDYRCMPSPRMNRLASPSLKRFNNKNTQISIAEFCNGVISSKQTHDPILIHSVMDACTFKAVYCSKTNQQNIAENYFKLVFKLMKLSLPQFNKNEVYNILKTRQHSLAKYHYTEHLVLFNNLSKSLDYIQKSKESCHDKTVLLSLNELSISLKINKIMSYPDSNVIHSPVAESNKYEFKTPATTKTRVNTKLKEIPRFVTPTVRKLKMTLESPKSRENKIKSPLVRVTEKNKKDSTAKKKSGKENIIKSEIKQDVEITVKVKRSTRKKEITEPLLAIKTRSNRLNI
ncbi:Hypothetical protein CINCED_3A000337 [Cinara cedri]|uniref:Separase n=1 Tax=Cinara cedri TaxID=506608 RepID=A0A5E4MSG3_9HEMI|nr:Hypothetical protein CINCED_3A000337 [Cinara cedri]